MLYEIKEIPGKILRYLTSAYVTLLISAYKWVRFEISLPPLLPYCKNKSGISGRYCIRKDPAIMSEIPKGQPVKFTITHYRQQQHSHEAFVNWIIHEHLPLALPVFEKYEIIEYSLVSICCCGLRLYTRVRLMGVQVRYAAFSQQCS